MDSIRTLEKGYFLQRLFSTFPNGWPGAGLMLIRAGLFAALLHFGSAGQLGTEPGTLSSLPRAVATVGGGFLLLGLWTPPIAFLVALNEVLISLEFTSFRYEERWLHLFLATVSAGVAMLGPGGWSVDARLFGRKRFDSSRTRSIRR